MAANISITILFVVIISGYQVTAQKRWAGTQTGNWDEMANWLPQGVPAINDDVILDNTYQAAAYTVNMPVTTVNIHTLSIEPSSGNSIKVIIPSSNKVSPALIINQSGTSFNIKEGAVFLNSSGLSSGESVQLSGMMSIYNGGRYIHNSRSSHATQLVAKLSAVEGTEKGVFEFDVPGGSYPISFSNRTYGTLILSSVASGGAQTYNASGTNQVQINGDFQLNNGVQFNLDLTKDMIINNDYIQNGGVFNIASQPNNNTVKIHGNVIQSSSGIISESSAGSPIIELNGNQNQQLALNGGILNSIAFMINNSKGVTLTASLIIPYKLLLIIGVMKTSMTNLLTLLDNSTCSGGSVDSFIDGPVRKIGDEDFEFPVGKQGDYAPVKISGQGAATDEFVAEYILGDPQKAYGGAFESPPLVRLSRLEYWMLERSVGSSAKKVSVSVGNYSNATSLANLVITGWDAQSNTWKNDGNSSYSGIATGILVSNEVNNFKAFTLASIVEMLNPLLLNAFKLEAVRSGSVIELSWIDTDASESDNFEIEQSFNGIDYQKVSTIQSKAGVATYYFASPAASVKLIYFRLKIIKANGSYLYSEILKLDETSVPNLTLKLLWSNLLINTSYNLSATMLITDMNGRGVRISKLSLIKGNNTIAIDRHELSNGYYVICLFDQTGRRLGMVKFKQ